MDFNWKDWQVALPEAHQGNMRVERFEITEEKAESYNSRSRWSFGPYRPVEPGHFTRLVECPKLHTEPSPNELRCNRCELWMSDTPAEVGEHRVAIQAINRLGGRVLINGLGIGVVVGAAIKLGATHVDVVERSPDVIRLAGPYYQEMAAAHGVALVVHEADAFEQAKAWPRGSRWEVVWSDIWPTINGDDLAEHGKLNRSYARRSRWHGSWNHGLVKAAARRSYWW